MAALDGENLSLWANVVVVSINHRLNALGFLDLSQYGDQYKYSSSCGLADLVLALNWIKGNIESFGGDPGNVTIMGQSGGGSKVAYLLQTPAADGLYHKAIMQSGGSAPRHEQRDRELLQGLAGKIVENLGLNMKTIEGIETIDYSAFAQATVNGLASLGKGEYFNWGPVADGDYFLGHQYDYGYREETKHIPILNGSVFSEMSGNDRIILAPGSKNGWDDDQVNQVLAKKFGESASAIKKAFISAYPEKKPVDVAYYDKEHRFGSVTFVKKRAAQKGSANCYNWMFTFESPWMGGILPWHCAEIPFVFHNADYTDSEYMPGISEKLQDRIAGAWVAFAKTGNPNHPGLPEWKPVTKDNVPTMIFDRECRLGNNFDQALLDLLP
jgi:para-nitrobenzyl esterase